MIGVQVATGTLSVLYTLEAECMEADHLESMGCARVSDTES